MKELQNSGEAILELVLIPACARIPVWYCINHLHPPQTGWFSQAICLTLDFKTLLDSWFGGYSNNYRLRHGEPCFVCYAKWNDEKFNP